MRFLRVDPWWADDWVRLNTTITEWEDSVKRTDWENSSMGQKIFHDDKSVLRVLA